VKPYAVKLYAELPARAARQLASDLLALCWLILFIAMAAHSHTVVLGLRAPAAAMVDAGNGVAGVFNQMAALAQLVPFVGSQLASVLQGGERVGQSLSDAGQQQVEQVGGLASGTALLVIVVGALPLLVLWLPVRLRYARDAGVASANRDAPGGPDLLALRALHRVPPQLLRSAAENPARAWRDGDPEVVAKLATLELDRLGLRPPT